MAGYSQRPLADKLGIKPGHVVELLTPPRGFRAALATPSDVTLRGRPGAGEVDVAVLFCPAAADLDARLAGLQRRVAQDGMIWVAWPKRASGVVTDLTEDVVRARGLATGWVDVKVCAIDETWSGLKLVRWLKDRTGAKGRAERRAP